MARVVAAASAPLRPCRASTWPIGGRLMESTVDLLELVQSIPSTSAVRALPMAIRVPHNRSHKPDDQEEEQDREEQAKEPEPEPEPEPERSVPVAIPVVRVARNSLTGA